MKEGKRKKRKTDTQTTYFTDITSFFIVQWVSTATNKLAYSFLPKLVIYLLIFVTSLLLINTAKIGCYFSLLMQLTYCLNNFYYSWGFYNSLHFHSQFLLLVTGIISLFSWGSKQNIFLVCLIIFDTRLIQWHKLCKSMLLLFFVCSTIHLKPFWAVVLALQSLKNSLNKMSEEKVDKWAKKYLLFVQLVANIQKAPIPQVIKEDSLNNLNIKNAFYYLNVS